MEALPANNERLLITTAVMSATLSQVLDTTNPVYAAPPHMQTQLGATSQISSVLHATRLIEQDIGQQAEMDE